MFQERQPLGLGCDVPGEAVVGESFGSDFVMLFFALRYPGITAYVAKTFPNDCPSR